MKPISRMSPFKGYSPMRIYWDLLSLLCVLGVAYSVSTLTGNAYLGAIASAVLFVVINHRYSKPIPLQPKSRGVVSLRTGLHLLAPMLYVHAQTDSLLSALLGVVAYVAVLGVLFAIALFSDKTLRVKVE